MDTLWVFRSSGSQRPERTNSLPRTAESAWSHEQAGQRCQQQELVIDPSESATVTANLRSLTYIGVGAKGSDNLPLHPYGPF